MVTYTCIGQVRGSCGHRHRSERAAIRCLDQDIRTGSDRRIVGSDGRVYELANIFGTGELTLEPVEDAESKIVDEIIAEFRGKPC